MHEWLTVIVVLLIAGILLDGWRRMRNARQGSIRVSRKARKMHDSSSAADEHFTSELPNGGARVIAKRDIIDAPRPVTQRKTPKPARQASESRIPQQVTLNLDESVPMLMESVHDEAKAAQTGYPADDADYDQAEYDEHTDDGYDTDEYEAEPDGVRYPGHGEESSLDVGHTDSHHYDSHHSDLRHSDAQHYDSRIEPSFTALDDEPEADYHEPVFETSHSDTHYPNEDFSEDQVPAAPDEVIIINVMALEGQYFAGDELLDSLLQNGLRYGDMDIFHRHVETSGEGPILFSLANMVKPGTFDLETMSGFYTPGVSLFMTLPLKGDSIRAFDVMRDIAEDICHTLGGELKDENRSVMTRQTMEHCRQRVTDYERRRLSRAGA